jgi:tetratricopeptide (TPR) repeat protein
VSLFCASLLLLFAIAQSQDPRTAYARALQLEKDGNYPAALVLLWEATGAAPRDADVQNRLGEALDRIGALDAAIDAYQRAVGARPDFVAADNNLTLALAKAGRGREAVARARARATAAPANVDRLFTLGLAQSEQDVDEAMKTFRRVIALRPDDALALYNLGLLLKRVDRTRDAIDALQRALAIEPRPEVGFALGTLYLHEGDFARAAAALEAALAAQPRFVDGYITLAAVLKARGQLPESIDALRRAIALQPDSWSAHASLATALQLAGEADAGRQETAVAERLRIQAALEREATTWTAVGIARLDAGDPAQAAERFRRALSVFEAYAPAHYQLGRALARLGQPDGARAAFARARQLNPSLVPPDTLK